MAVVSTLATKQNTDHRYRLINSESFNVTASGTSHAA